MNDHQFALLVDLVKSGVEECPEYVDPVYWRHAKLCAAEELRKVVYKQQEMFP